MNRVVDHIQTHLTDPLDLERLAAVACFSPFHFHRLFRSWMGETLQAHVQRLRLECAARLLSIDQRKTITEIALDCGFPINVQVRRLEPATLAYIRHIGSYKGDAALFRRLFAQLFAWAGPRGLMGPEARYLSLFQDNPNLTPAAKQRLEVALTVPSGTAPDGPIGMKPLEGGLYAVARVRVLIHEYAEPWEALVVDWLPGSGYQPDGRPALEIYLNNPDTDPEGRFDLEICFPVRPL